MSRPIITSFPFEVYFWVAFNALEEMNLRPHIEVSAKVAKEYQLATPNVNVSPTACRNLRTENNRLKFGMAIGGQPIEMDIHLSEIVCVHGLRDASGYAMFPMPVPKFGLMCDADADQYHRLQEKAYPYDDPDESIEAEPPGEEPPKKKEGVVIQGQFGKKK